MADLGGAQAAAPEPALTVAAVARRLGVAPATLRTWDRRYGLGPSAHTPGAHRRYTVHDLARLQVMRQLTVEGVAPADAARLALAAGERPLARSAAAPDSRLASVSPLWPAPPATPAQSGGGRVVAMPGGSAQARGLARAALALDSYACIAIIESVIERDGVARAWEKLCLPVLTAIGERWAMTGEGVEVEHLLADVVTGCLSRATAAPARARNARPVLLACVAQELHVLPLHVVAAVLAERNISSRVLGARTPLDALRSAVERSGPVAVLLWCQLAQSADTAQFASLPSQRPAPLLIAGGPGWEGVVLPDEVMAAHSLSAALLLIESALTGLRP